MDALDRLLALPEHERIARGLQFTPREIDQQPTTWRVTVARLTAQRHALLDFLAPCGLRPHGGTAPVVRLIGAGSSDYVGRAVRALLAKQWRCEVNAVPSTDLLTNPQDWIVSGQPYLWVWFSRSGDSPESVAALERSLAESREIRHLVITCNQDSQLVRLFSGEERILPVVLDDAVNDRGLAMTSSFSNMIVAAHVLAHVFSPAHYAGVLERLSSAGQAFRARAAHVCAALASAGHAKVCFLGTGALNAVAHECALKLLELTAGRVSTMAHSSLGVRHGPLSGLDGETLLVTFLSSDDRRRGYETDLLAEIRAKNLVRATVAITPADSAASPGLADEVLSNGATALSDDYRPPVDALFGQLLALFSSVHHGLKPDTPSPNGAISRVVSGVRIHQ